MVTRNELTLFGEINLDKSKLKIQRKVFSENEVEKFEDFLQRIIGCAAN